ncbi:MAG: hypothetical protein RJA22_2665 [Verrucomicrobiota bacterium]|jgi:hypothetical protein
MNVHELKTILERHPDLPVRFLLPDGTPVAPHAHVTEVAQVTKRFIDCGGTLRDDVLCRLQTWVADDVEHRLTSRKLLGILNKASTTVLASEDLAVDVEHEVAFISQFPLEGAAAAGGELQLRLGVRHTACLAPDQCRPKPKPESLLFKRIPNLKA